MLGDTIVIKSLFSTCLLCVVGLWSLALFGVSLASAEQRDGIKQAWVEVAGERTTFVDYRTVVQLEGKLFGKPVKRIDIMLYREPRQPYKNPNANVALSFDGSECTVSDLSHLAIAFHRLGFEGSRTVNRTKGEFEPEFRILNCEGFSYGNRVELKLEGSSAGRIAPQDWQPMNWLIHLDLTLTEE